MTTPTGRQRKRGKVQETEEKQDGYANAFSGLGTSRDRAIATYATSSIVGRAQAQQIYMGDGIGARLVNIIAEDTTRAGVDFDGLEEELEDQVLAKFDDLKVMAHMQEAVRWSEVFGGALIVLGLNDGGTLDQPLNIDGLRSVEFIRVYDRYQTSVRTRFQDPNSPNFGRVEKYLISPLFGASPYEVHESRTLRIDGNPLPDFFREQNEGWGASRYQSCKESLERLGASHQWANAMLERSQQPVHGIPDLAAILSSPGGESAVRQRVNAVDFVRSVLSTVVIDGQETYEIKTAPLTGVPDILDRFAEKVCAETGIPFYLLMGRSPSGLNSAGAANEDGWHSKVQAMQVAKLLEPLNKLTQFILYSINQDTGGDWKLEFCPLKIESEKEEKEIEKLEAETKKIEAETYAALASINVIDPREIREKLAQEYGLTEEIPESALPDDESILNGQA